MDQQWRDRTALGNSMSPDHPMKTKRSQRINTDEAVKCPNSWKGCVKSTISWHKWYGEWLDNASWSYTTQSHCKRGLACCRPASFTTSAPKKVTTPTFQLSRHTCVVSSQSSETRELSVITKPSTHWPLKACANSDLQTVNAQDMLQSVASFKTFMCQNCVSTWQQCCGHKVQWQLALKCVKLKAAWRAIMCTHRVIQQNLANHDLLTIPPKLSSCFEERTGVHCQVKSVDKSGDKNYKRRIALEIEACWSRETVEHFESKRHQRYTLQSKPSRHKKVNCALPFGEFVNVLSVLWRPFKRSFSFHSSQNIYTSLCLRHQKGVFMLSLGRYPIIAQKG